jgi:hypothetical protein
MDELEGVSNTSPPDSTNALSVLRDSINGVLESQNNSNTEPTASERFKASINFSHENDTAIESNLNPDLTMETAALFVERIRADADQFLNAQANVEPEVALALLQD